MAVPGSGRREWSWGAAALVGCAVALGTLLPAFELATEAVSGPLGEEVAHRYEERVTLAWDAGLVGLAPIAIAGLVVVSAVAAHLGGARLWPAAGILVGAIGLALLLGAVDAGVVRWTVGDDPRVYQGQGGAGPLVESAVDRLRERAAASEEAADPTWRLRDDGDAFGITRLTGWTLVSLSTPLLFLLGVFRVARLRLSPWLAAPVAVAVTGLVLLWFFLRALDEIEL